MLFSLIRWKAESHVKDNSYAGEYITMNAKIKDIRSVRAGDLSAYRIELMSLNDTLYKQSPGMGSVKKAGVMVKHRWSYELPGEFRIDEDIGIPLRDGDTIVIVGYAGLFIGVNRNRTVDGEGTISLLLTGDEYEKRKEVIHCDTKEIGQGVIAAGSYDRSKLVNNTNLLDYDGLLSLLDPDPNVKNPHPPTPTPTIIPTPTLIPTTPNKTNVHTLIKVAPGNKLRAAPEI